MIMKHGVCENIFTIMNSTIIYNNPLQITMYRYEPMKSVNLTFVCHILVYNVHHEMLMNKNILFKMDFLSSSTTETCHDGGLDIFEEPEYTENFQSQSDVLIQPTAPPSDSPHASYTFVIGGKDDRLYTTLSSIKIIGRLRVTLQNGGALSDEKISTVCNFPESLFENINVTLNNTPISDHGRAYAYKSYITKKLSLTPVVKTSSLLSNYWLEESNDANIKIENTNLSDAFTERAKLIEGSRDVYFIFNPLVDLFNTEKYLPPHIELKIDLERGPVSLPLLSPDQNLNAKISILDINMSVRRFTPIQRIAIQHEKKFMGGGFVNLPFTRSTIRYRTLHGGLLSTVVPNLFSGQLPYSFVVAFLTNEQQSLVNYDPFVFKPHRLKKFNIVKNGVNVPQEPINVGTADGSFLRGYTHFIENTGGTIFNSTNGITPVDYFQKSFFLAFDLTPDFCLGSHNHKTESGTIDLCLQFSEPTKVPLTLLVLGCFENTIRVSKDEVKLDFAL